MDEMSMCANFFWNRPSRLGGDSGQTDTQTDTQTDNGIYNIDVAQLDMADRASECSTVTHSSLDSNWDLEH